MTAAGGVDDPRAYRHLVRLRGRNGRVVGAGVLLQGRYVLTCAHVVNSSLGRAQMSQPAPDETVLVELPALPELGVLAATVIGQTWIAADESRPEDVTVLRLATPVLGPLDTPPLRTRVRVDSDFRCYGFPDGRDEPVLALGAVQGAMGPEFGWHQLVTHGVNGYQIAPGFSGGPVWSDTAGAVIGIVVTVDGRQGRRVGCMLPLSRIASLPVMGELLAESARFDPTAWQAHWEPAVRGTRLRPGDDTWYFTGRRAVLADLRNWFGTQGPEQPIGCVVTGPPGSGKSAVLARVATLSSAAYRDQHPQAWQGAPADTVPEPGAVDVAIHARDLDLAQVCATIAEAAGCPDERPERLVAALCARPEPFTLLIDALDEAVDGGASIVQGLLLPLAAYGRPGVLRVLVGARPHLVPELGGGYEVVQLDDDAYLDRDDLLAYTSTRLNAHPAATGADIAALSATIADAAHPLFLVAQLTVDALCAGDGPAGWTGDFPSTVPQAINTYLLRSFAPQDARRARDLLRPLAYAQDTGLPTGELWAALASHLAGRDYGTDDVRWLRDRAAALLARSAVGAEGEHHRLFHAAFAAGLFPDPESGASAFFDALLSTVPLRPDGTRDWPAASRYLYRHLAYHAERAGRMAELAQHPGFLPVADTADVLRAHTRSGHVLGRELSHVLASFAGETTTEDPAERAAALALHLMYRGRRDLADGLLAQARGSRWRPLWFTGGDTAAVIHRGAVRALAEYEVEGRRLLASCADDGSVIVHAIDPAPIGGVLRGTATLTFVASVDAHVGGATALTPLADEPRLASGGADGVIQVWDAATLEPEFSLDAHHGPITALCSYRDADGLVIVSGGADGAVRFWHSFDDDGNVGITSRRAHVGGVAALRTVWFGDDLLVLSVGRDGALLLWDPAERDVTITHRTDRDHAVSAVDVWSSDAAIQVTAVAADGVAQIWDISQGVDGDGDTVTSISHQVTTFHARPAFSAVRLAAHQHGLQLIRAAGPEVTVTPLAESDDVLTVEGVEGVSTLACLYSATGPDLLVLGGTSGTVRVWSYQDGYPAPGREYATVPQSATAVATVEQVGGPVAVIAHGGSGGYSFQHEVGGSVTSTVTTSSQADRYPRVEIRRLHDGAETGPAKVLAAPAVLQLVVGREPSGLRLGAVSRDTTCRTWITGTEAVAEHGVLGKREFAVAAAVAAGTLDSRAVVAVGSRDGGVWFFDLVTGRSRRMKWFQRDHHPVVIALGRIGDRDVLATWDPAHRERIRLWNAGNGRELAAVERTHTAPVTALSLHDGLLAWGGSDGVVALHRLDAKVGAVSADLRQAHTGRVTALCGLRLGDETVTVSGGHDGQLRFWPVRDGATYPDAVWLGTPVLSTAAGPSGHLAVGTEIGPLALHVGRTA
ncbi:hypothetical protein Cme02nite_51380 [Catellatospora methionotrophica]|uniref:Orc1-like AAA ATPase domain-containing protein n=1 Tax=Catellatospora methionotrophica TaxID=121620 RepID=A0A8J3LKE7_9ACTN|nr:trypsin-like peptidase domain-containing protein [Catellatospora methionotrophica]GIG16806.1 hypothetical protein Cme02nite_51380 [Catellatospora methionotrophica]